MKKIIMIIIFILTIQGLLLLTFKLTLVVLDKIDNYTIVQVNELDNEIKSWITSSNKSFNIYELETSDNFKAIFHYKSFDYGGYSTPYLKVKEKDDNLYIYVNLDVAHSERNVKDTLTAVIQVPFNPNDIYVYFKDVTSNNYEIIDINKK